MLAVRLIQVGEEFSGGNSESLEESIRRQSLNYFRSYHRAKLDELRMFLENEGWELCPVKPSFSILMLQVGTVLNPFTHAHGDSCHMVYTPLPGHYRVQYWMLVTY